MLRQERSLDGYQVLIALTTIFILPLCVQLIPMLAYHPVWIHDAACNCQMQVWPHLHRYHRYGNIVRGLLVVMFLAIAIRRLRAPRKERVMARRQESIPL